MDERQSETYSIVRVERVGSWRIIDNDNFIKITSKTTKILWVGNKTKALLYGERTTTTTVHQHTFT